jgi:hypothetical protein
MGVWHIFYKGLPPETGGVGRLLSQQTAVARQYLPGHERDLTYILQPRFCFGMYHCLLLHQQGVEGDLPALPRQFIYLAQDKRFRQMRKARHDVGYFAGH